MQPAETPKCHCAQPRKSPSLPVYSQIVVFTLQFFVLIKQMRNNTFVSELWSWFEDFFKLNRARLADSPCFQSCAKLSY